jgi:hypothetical protein
MAIVSLRIGHLYVLRVTHFNVLFSQASLLVAGRQAFNNSRQDRENNPNEYARVD